MLGWQQRAQGRRALLRLRDRQLAMLQQMQTIGLRRIAIVHQNDGFGKDSLQIALTAFAAKDLKPVITLAVEASGSNTPDLARQLAALPDLDVRAGLANLADHQGTYLRLLKSFAHGRAECTAEFRSLLAAGDPEAARRLVHSAKASCAILGISGLRQKFESLEFAVRDGKVSAAVLDPLIAVVEAELNTLLPAILLAIADDLESRYQAKICAAFVREAATLYVERKKLKGDD